MSDLVALTAELHHTTMRLQSAEKHIEVLQRQVVERDEMMAEKDRRIATCEMAKDVYFQESRTYRMGMERLLRLQCEGYIGEPA